MNMSLHQVRYSGNESETQAGMSDSSKTLFSC